VPVVGPTPKPRTHTTSRRPWDDFGMISRTFVLGSLALLVALAATSHAAVANRSTNRSLTAAEMKETIGGGSGPFLCCAIANRCTIPATNAICGAQTSDLACTSARNWVNGTVNLSECGVIGTSSYCQEANAGDTTPCLYKYGCQWKAANGTCTPIGLGWEANAPSYCYDNCFYG